MPIFSSVNFAAVQWAARKGLRGEREIAHVEEEPSDRMVAASRLAERKQEAR